MRLLAILIGINYKLRVKGIIRDKLFWGDRFLWWMYKRDIISYDTLRSTLNKAKRIAGLRW